MALRAQTVCISSHGQTLSNSLLQGWPRAHGPGKGWRRAQGDPAGTRQSLPAEAATQDWCYYKKQNSLIPAGHQVLLWILYGTAKLSCGGMHLLLRNSPESLCFIQSLMRDYPGSVISQLGESTPTPCVQCRDTDEWMIQASVISHQRNPVLNMVEVYNPPRDAETSRKVPFPKSIHNPNLLPALVMSPSSLFLMSWQQNSSLSPPLLWPECSATPFLCKEH